MSLSPSSGHGAALRFETSTMSAPGTYAANEDAAGEVTADGRTLLVVADGLGGHAHGEVASALAVASCLAAFQAHPSLDAGALESLFIGAHGAIAAAAASASHPPRTTLVLLAIDEANGRWAHVGDSRLYHFRAGRVAARTRDHSVPEMLHKAGDIRDDEIRTHPDRPRLLHVLGQGTPPKAAVSSAVPLASGDAFLLCSDGWWEPVEDEQMERTLSAAADPGAWLTTMRTLVERAARRPQDNYTATAVFVR